MARPLWNLRVHRWTAVTVGCGLLLVVGLAFFAGTLTGHWWAERPPSVADGGQPTDGSESITTPDAANLGSPAPQGVADPDLAPGPGTSASPVGAPRVSGPTATGPAVTGPAVRGPQISSSGVTGPRLEGPRVQRPTVRGPRVSAPTSPRLGGGRVGGGTVSASTAATGLAGSTTGGPALGASAAGAPTAGLPAAGFQGPVPGDSVGQPSLGPGASEGSAGGDAASGESAPVELFAIQVGLYADPEDAQADVEALSGRGHAPYVVRVRALDRGTVARSVRLGPFPSHRLAWEAARNFELDEGRSAAVVRELEGIPESP